MNILTDIFTDPRPCEVCEKNAPTFTEPSTGTRYCLPCLEKAVDAVDAEIALSAKSDVYDVLLAFDKALDAAPKGAKLLRPWTQRFPQFADDLIAVGFARFMFGWTLSDPVEDGPEDPEAVAIGREVLNARLLPTGAN